MVEEYRDESLKEVSGTAMDSHLHMVLQGLKGEAIGQSMTQQHDSMQSLPNRKCSHEIKSSQSCSSQ